MQKKLNENEKFDKENPTKNISAAEIAKTMIDNMATNMNNPNFIEEQELLKDRVRHEVLQKRKSIK